MNFEEEQFDYHWDNFHDDLSPQKIKLAKEFLLPLIDLLSKSQSPLRILDAGCGNGIHAFVLSRYKDFQFQYLGVDISRSAIRDCINFHREDSRFNFIRSNIETIEFENQFDIIFSYGVFSYIEKPNLTVKHLVNYLKDDGFFLSWVYSPSFFSRKLLSIIRFFTTKLNKNLQSIVADLIVYIMQILPVSSGLNLSNSSFQQCKETVMVNIRPKRLLLPSKSEVNKWHTDANLSLVKDRTYYQK